MHTCMHGLLLFASVEGYQVCVDLCVCAVCVCVVCVCWYVHVTCLLVCIRQAVVWCTS